MTRGLIGGADAANYDLHRNHKNYVQIKEFLLHNIEPSNTSTICDLCCGTGFDIEALKGVAGEIVGVDLSADMIEICKKKFNNYKKAKFIAANATDTKLPSDYFDYVIINMGLHHIKNKAALIDEVYRLLNLNGVFIIIDKYYLSIPELYAKSFIKLLKIGKFTAFEEFIISKKANKQLIGSKFRIINQKLLPTSRDHIGQTFLYALCKK